MSKVNLSSVMYFICISIQNRDTEVNTSALNLSDVKKSSGEAYKYKVSTVSLKC